MAQIVKNLPAMWETWVRSQGWASQVGVVVKNTTANAGDIRDTGSILVSGRYPGVWNDNPLQYSCLENSQGQKSLEGYSPWGHKESDTTEQLMLLGAPPLFSPSSSSRSSKLALKLFCTCWLNQVLYLLYIVPILWSGNIYSTEDNRKIFSDRE